MNSPENLIRQVLKSRPALVTIKYESSEHRLANILGLRDTLKPFAERLNNFLAPNVLTTEVKHNF